MKLKPLEAFLVSVHPEVVERGSVLLAGQAVEFGNASNRDVKRLIKEHYAEGQKALKDFNKWLVRSESMRQYLADRVTATVWNSLCMTFDVETEIANPMLLLDRSDETYSYGSKMKIAHDLRFWARYKKDSVLYEKLLLWLKRKPDVAPQYVLDSLEVSPPYTKQEYRRLLKALEEFKGSPRHPWAWPCLRIVFTCGVSLVEIVQLEHAKVYQTIRDGKILIAIGKPGSRRSVQTALVEEELKLLLAFPFQWGVVGDIIDPAKINSARATYTTHPLSKVAKAVFQRARVEYTPSWTSRLRWSAAWQYYQKTGNLVGASQILGKRNLASVSAFFEELKRRAEKVKSEKEAEDESGE